MITPKRHKIKHKILGKLYEKSKEEFTIITESAVSQIKLEKDLKISHDELLTAVRQLQLKEQLRIVSPESHGKDENTYLLIEHPGTSAYLNKEYLIEGQKEFFEKYRRFFAYIMTPLALIATILAISSKFQSQKTTRGLKQLESRVEEIEFQIEEIKTEDKNTVKIVLDSLRNNSAK
jgi:hypothetical protein